MADTPVTNDNRLPWLDYLRGLAAAGIMLYHYTMWTMGDYDASRLGGRVGVYGVVIFYMLSGITLYHVYAQRIGPPSRRGLARFAIKRVGRIFPLLWLVTVATLLIKSEDFPASTIVLNVTGLFGMYHWWETVCYGAWSIGNELVFYLFFPVFVFLARRSVALFAAFAAVLLAIYLWYTFGVMDASKPLTGEYWIPYINPLNQVFYFLSGFIIGWVFRRRHMPQYAAVLLMVAGMAAFVLCPASGNVMQLIAGGHRIAFTIICMVICTGAYKAARPLPGVLHKFFHMLGQVSYAVYLGHPLVTFVLTRLAHRFYPSVPVAAIITICAIATILISLAIYHLYELPAMRLGRRLAGRLGGAQRPDGRQ